MIPVNSIENYSNSSIRKNLTFFMSIKNEYLRREFSIFKKTQNCTYSLFALLVLSILVYGLALIPLSNRNIYPSKLSAGLKSSLIGLIIASICFYLVSFLTLFYFKFTHKISTNAVQKYLQCCVIIGGSLIAQFLQLWPIFSHRAAAGSKCYLMEIYYFPCGPNLHANSIHFTNSLVLVLLLPFIHKFVFKDSSLKVVLISLFFSVSSLLATIIYNNELDLLISWLVYVCFSFIIIMDGFMFELRMFFITKELKLTLTENKKLASESQANEMRFLIANLAHDLKSVIFEIVFILHKFTYFNHLIGFLLFFQFL